MIAFTLAVGGVLAAVAPASAALPPATLSLDSAMFVEEGPYPGPALLSGSGWTPNHEVIVELNFVSNGPAGIVDSTTVMSDGDGNFSLSWPITASLEPTAVDPWFYSYRFFAREEATPQNGNDTRISNEPLLFVYPTPGARTLTVSDTAYDPGTWGDGIPFTSTGWEPNRSVNITVTRISSTGPDATQVIGAPTGADGTIGGVFTPTTFVPELPGPDGFPQYEISASQFDASGNYPIHRAAPVALTVTPPPPPPPSITVTDPEYVVGDWRDGIEVVGTDFPAGADVLIRLTFEWHPADTSSATFETTADENGEFVYLIPASALGSGPLPPWNLGPTHYVQAQVNDTWTDRVTLTILPGPITLTAFDSTFVEGDDWHSGIYFDAQGLLPAAPATIQLEMVTEEGTTVVTQEPYTTTSSGTITARFTPTGLAAAPGSDGFPQYRLVAVEQRGDETVRSNTVPLTIEPAPLPPRIEGPDTVDADDLADGVPFTFSGFLAEEEVVLVLSAVIGGQPTELGRATIIAGPDGEGEFEAIVRDLAATTTITIDASGLESGRSATFSVLAVVAPTPGASGGDGATGALAATGVSQVAGIGGVAGSLLLIGVLTLLALSRRRIAAVVGRR